jgi:CDP-diacylglycerol--serine O-phosphatidyltransferase
MATRRALYYVQSENAISHQPAAMTEFQPTRLRFLRRAADQPRRRFRRGVYLLPSLLTMANMFCGYACVVYAMRGEFETAAPYIGYAVVLDIFDGRLARLTGTTSAFGVEFDSLADVISFGMAPAILALTWGLSPLGRLGWAVGFLFVAAAAMRLARFNIQTSTGGDKRYFVGMPSPAAAAIPAATVFFLSKQYPDGLSDYREALPVLAMVLVPAVLMVSTIRFRSFKTLAAPTRRPYTVLIFVAAGIVLIATHPRWMLVVMAYSYLASAFVGQAISRFKRRGGRPGATLDVPHEPVEEPSPRNTRAK